MSNVVPFTGERLTPSDTGNADLALHLRSLAQEIEDGDHGEAMLASVIIYGGDGCIRQYHRTSRHFTCAEYLGLLEVAKHQILTDSHPPAPGEADHD